MKRKAFLYEPDPELRLLLEQLFEKEEMDTYSVTDFPQVSSWVPAEVNVIDMNVFSYEVIQLFRHIRSQSTAAVIIAVVPQQDLEQWYRILCAGVNYCLTKSDRTEYFLKDISIALDTCLERMKGKIYYTADLMINMTQERVFRGFEELYFTSNEFEILSMLVKARGEFVAGETLRQADIGAYNNRSIGAIATHISHIRAKLGTARAGCIYIDKKRMQGYRWCQTVVGGR